MNKDLESLLNRTLKSAPISSASTPRPHTQQIDLPQPPPRGEEFAHRSPQEIMDEIASLDAESAEVLRNVDELLGKTTVDA